MVSSVNVNKLAMIGCGSMGGGLALLFAEKGFEVSLSDPADDTMDELVKKAKEQGFGDRLHKFKDYESLCGSLCDPKILVFSLPHGTVGDSVLEGLLPYLKKNDIILDAGNENYVNTERRQGQCTTKGIRYVGMGVSGGYQAARHGPSMCPGGDEQTLEMVMPMLEKVAAKDPQGRACVGRCGLGGSGHYVKMVHNGIEHGMMSAIAEAWRIMEDGLGMGLDEIGDVFEKWNADGELRGTFLINIGADICRKKDSNDSSTHVLSTVQDKVVQDITGEEGTGVWSNMECVRLHVPAPTLTTAHYLRIASAFRGRRERASKAFDHHFKPQPIAIKDKAFLLEDLRRAVYTACLAAYIQGINLIEEADKQNKWSIDYAAVWQIWRAGCIIQADYISEMLEDIFKNYQRRDSMDLLFEEKFAKDLIKGAPSLKKVVIAAVEADHVVPALSASLEYVKYMSSLDLPTSFYEAELDYFGKHMYDRKGENVPDATEGKHHFEWKPA